MLCLTWTSLNIFLLGGMSGSGDSATKNSRICNPRSLAKYQYYPHANTTEIVNHLQVFLKHINWSVKIFTSIPVRWAAWTWNKFPKVFPRIFIALQWLVLGTSDLSRSDQYLWSFLCPAHLWETIHFHSYSNTSNEICIKLHIFLNFNGVTCP